MTWCFLKDFFKCGPNSDTFMAMGYLDKILAST
jgi:hypothetical protein